MAKKLLSDQQRFFKSIVVTDVGCWIWKKAKAKAKDKDGYGLFKIYPKMLRAHRWIYEHLKCKIPDGFQIDHLCCNPGCVNPDHLQTVTPLRNTQLGWERGTHIAHHTSHTKATKEKIRYKALGRKVKRKTHLKMSLARLGNKNCLGFKHSEETKEKHRRNAIVRIRNELGQLI